VVTNLFGTAKRLELAFGSRPQKFVQDLVNLTESIMPLKAKKLWDNRNLFMDGLKIGLKEKRQGAILDNCQLPPRLGSLPMLTSWHSDGGAFVHCLSSTPSTQAEKGTTWAMYRIQRHDETTTGIPLADP